VSVRSHWSSYLPSRTSSNRWLSALFLCAALLLLRAAFHRFFKFYLEKAPSTDQSVVEGLTK